MSKNNKWILVRGDEVVGTFDTRKEGVSHIKKMLRQTLNDLDKQDKTDEFDYNIEYPKMQLYGVEIRPTYLGL